MVDCTLHFALRLVESSMVYKMEVHESRVRHCQKKLSFMFSLTYVVRTVAVVKQKYKCWSDVLCDYGHRVRHRSGQEHSYFLCCDALYAAVHLPSAQTSVPHRLQQ